MSQEYQKVVQYYTISIVCKRTKKEQRKTKKTKKNQTKKKNLSFGYNSFPTKDRSLERNSHLGSISSHLALPYFVSEYLNLVYIPRVLAH